MQTKLVYSLLKPAVAFAAQFGIPIKSLVDLFRLAYYEHLAKKGLSQREISEYFGQSDRHMRSLAQRLRSDFFAAERDIGLTREIEEFVAMKSPTRPQLLRKFDMWEESDLEGAVSRLLEQGRIVESKGRYEIAAKYTILGSDRFQNRLDALNHFLEGAQHAVSERMIADNQRSAMVKTISFSASEEAMERLIKDLENFVRAKVSAAEEDALFSSSESGRYVVAVAASPLPRPSESSAAKDAGSGEPKTARAGLTPTRRKEL